MTIVLLGWGSLLWEPHLDFGQQHADWRFDGPELKLEFSRVSSSRRGALTLVIDSAYGALCRVAYSLSKRTDPDDALCDLRSREGTTRRNIGVFSADGSRQHARDQETLEAIAMWARAKSIDIVIWTDLKSNFERVCGRPFGLEAAVAHLQALDSEAKVGAAEYVWRAPAFIDTPLRRALQAQPWFQG